MAERIATDMEPRSRLLLVERLEKLKVKIFTGHEVKAGKATEEGLLLVIRSREGKDTKLLVDSLIIAVGFRPEKSLSVRLKQRGIEPVEVGDCKRVGNIKEAIHQGFWWMYEKIRC
jgi:pyruvate/2-oxoglutarate dehydrogenase complex dihydrolipoamide dehydrogenase (E3) component